MQVQLTINARGAITLPAKMLTTVGLKAGDHLIAEITPGGLLLRTVGALPLEMYLLSREQVFDAAEADLAIVFASALKV